MLALLLIGRLAMAAETVPMSPLPLPDRAEGRAHTGRALIRAGAVGAAVGLTTVSAGVIVALIPTPPCNSYKDNEGYIIPGMELGLAGFAVMATSAPLFIAGAVVNAAGHHHGEAARVQLSAGPRKVVLSGTF